MKKEITREWIDELIYYLFIEHKDFHEVSTLNSQGHAYHARRDKYGIVYICIDNLYCVTLDRELGRVEFANFERKEMVEFYKALKCYFEPLYVVSIK